MNLVVLLLTISVHCVAPSHTPAQKRKHKVFLAPSESFAFNMSCGPWTAEKCQSAKQDLKGVGKLIASEIYFKEPVHVCVKMDDVPLPPEHKIRSRHVANMTMNKMSSKLKLI